MRAHVIVNGIVVNTIEVESLDFAPNLIDGSVGAIGWSFVDGSLIPPAPSQTATERNAQILSALEAIDRKTPRAVRESIQTGDSTRVIALETEAATLRAQLVKV